MWYFAYGSNLNLKAVAQWCRHHNLKMPDIKRGTPAIVDNYRLCFPIYSDYWGGGTADIVYDPGKYVAGVLYDVTEPDMAILDQKVDRKLDASGREIGTYRRMTVNAAPLTKGLPVQAITYQGTNPDHMNIAPTRHYMDLLIQGACAYGLSMMWVAYLQSFTTQAGRDPRASKTEPGR